MPPPSHQWLLDCECRCNDSRYGSPIRLPAKTKHLAVILLLVIFGTGHPGGDLLAQEPFSIRSASSADAPWELEADSVRHDQVKDEYVATGNVVIQRLDQSIAADQIRFNRQTMIAEAIGNVVAISGSDIVTGSYLQIDLEKEIGYIDNGEVFIKENNYHIQGDRIEKTGPTTYTADRATITTCDGDKPAWKFTGRDVEVHEDGSGSAKHVAFYARDLPVLYFPYIYYPARENRQTGFLIPQFSLGDRKGFSYNQPFFWAVSDSQDATFYANPMSKRGIKTGIEYRYYLNSQTKGAILLDGFRDQQRDDGSPDARAKWGFGDGDDDFPRPNRDRYWFRMSHHQVLPGAVNGKLDLDLISDQDYLREFKTGFMGFEDTNTYFLDHFSRDLDDSNDPVRVNRLLFNKTWPSYTFNAEARWYQNVTRELNSTDTVQKLPFVEFNASKQKIATSPFFYTFNSAYNNFWRINGSRAQRLDLFPRIYYPWRFKHYFTLEPSIGGRETVWYQYKKDNSDPWDDDTFHHRELYDTRVTLFTDFQKIFDVDGKTLKRIKHTIRPFVSHEYIPDVDQSDLPNLEAQDRIEELSLLTYSLTNTLTSKSLKNGRSLQGHPRKRLRGGQIARLTDYDFQDFLRFKVEQSYDFNKNRRPFLPILADLDFRAGKYLNIDADASWSVYDNLFLSRNAAVTLWDWRGDRLFVEYRYDRASDDDPDIGDENETESIFADLEMKATDRLRFFVDYKRNIEENLRLRTSVGFSYKSQCWTAVLRYTDRPDDQEIEVKIDLHGIGEFGF
jgi:LPS-assembly protein